MKNHLKRIAAPRTWIINRKSRKYIVRPTPSGHAFSFGLPLTIILRDELHLASTAGEVKKLLNNNEVLIDGRRRTDHRYLVGLFDVISFASLKKSYRLILDTKGRLALVEIPESEKAMKLVKVTGKTVLPKGKMQYHLHDGKNIISEVSAHVGDTFVLEKLPLLEIKEVLSLVPGNHVFLTQGKHSGDTGELKSITGKDAVYLVDKEPVETAKSYLFVVGKQKPLITIKND
jgi:small subunit ribosomal protein S4e